MFIAQFQRSNELREFCRRYNRKSPAEIHNSFATMDRISMFIKKQKLLRYPEGTQLQGVVFEKRVRHGNPETVSNMI